LSGQERRLSLGAWPVRKPGCAAGDAGDYEVELRNRRPQPVDGVIAVEPTLLRRTRKLPVGQARNDPGNAGLPWRCRLWFGIVYWREPSS